MEQPTPDFKNKFEECDDRFETIFKLTSAASKIIDCNLTILKVNKALIELLGYTEEEIVGTKILDYACEEYKHHWSELQDAMWKQGKSSFKLDACIYKKDQSLAWIHVTTVLFEQDNVSYGFSVLDDFSYLKHYQESQKRLSMALQYSRMAVMELNLEENTIIHSEGFDQLFGYQTQLNNWDKDKILTHFMPEDAARLEKILSSIVDDMSIDFKGRIKTPDGVIKWVHLQGKGEKDVNGKPKRIIGTIYDITKEKLAELHKDDFISIASHELKTPITALKASLQLMNMIKDSSTDKLHGLIEQANKSMGKVSVLIEDLLSASRINEGQLFLNKTRFNLFKVIEECRQHVATIGQFNIITEGEQNIEVEADAERIQLVLINFVNNAMKYASGSKDIYIRMEKINESVKVSVTDFGPGIPEEKLPYIFDRYYRADLSGSPYSGLGLGLYISAEIIKKHDGEIGVNSETGKGSTFWFTLPL